MKTFAHNIFTAYTFVYNINLYMCQTINKKVCANVSAHISSNSMVYVSKHLRIIVLGFLPSVRWYMCWNICAYFWLYNYFYNN